MNPEVAIAFEGFQKRFGDVDAVRPLDLSIRKGETFALLGPNGSGKSTLIRAVAGLIRATSGRVLVNGVDIALEPNGGGRQIAYMPQRVTLPDQLTARETVSFFARLRNVDQGEVVRALASVSLEAAADRRVREFSGGMLQRLGLAVAFLEEASIYILDEPTLNLDPVGLDRFRERVSALKKGGATILFSTHILQDAAQLADRVGILADGALVRVDPLSEFRSLVSLETTVRVVLESTSERIVEAAVAAGARTASVNGTHYSFRASPGLRLDVIRAIEGAGGTIEEFHTDPPEWEGLIKQGMIGQGGPD